MYFGDDFNELISLENYVDFPNSLNINEATILSEAIDPDEGFGNTLRPVFIVLLYSDSSFDRFVEKFVKGQNYWHAAISFGPALSRCYSYNFGEANANKIKGGLSFESIGFYKKEHPEGTMEVSAFFINKEKYKKIKDSIEYYIKNKEKTKYSFINLFWSYIGKQKTLRLNQVCSTFVDALLKSVDIDVNGKPTNLVKPDDLMKKEMLRKQFIIYKGKIKDFDADKVIARTDKLSQNIKNDYFY